jgi:hypothetical protein
MPNARGREADVDSNLPVVQSIVAVAGAFLAAAGQNVPLPSRYYCVSQKPTE